MLDQKKTYIDVIFKKEENKDLCECIHGTELCEDEIVKLDPYDINLCVIMYNGYPTDIIVNIALSKFKNKNILFYNERYSCYQIMLGQIEFIEDISKKFNKYPYDIERLYSAQKNLKRIAKLTDLPKNKINKQVKDLVPYTFGIEYETSSGHIPINYCYKNGLIPLRDGSISGNEYATIILNNTFGFDLIKNQMLCLNKYTDFNRDCSIHIHFGKIPMEPMFVYFLYQICYSLQTEIKTVLPHDVFNSGRFKSNGKDYCKLLPHVNNFDEMYNFLSCCNNVVYEDMYQFHPNDLNGDKKWQIPSRYYWVNFVNLMFYNKNKTVEFRFLSPTHNYKKLINWIYILSAIIQYSYIKYSEIKIQNMTEINTTLNNLKPNLIDIINTIYPLNISSILYDFLENLQCIKRLQELDYDFSGLSTIFDDLIITNCVLDE